MEWARGIYEAAVVTAKRIKLRLCRLECPECLVYCVERGGPGRPEVATKPFQISLSVELPQRDPWLTPRAPRLRQECSAVA